MDNADLRAQDQASRDAPATLGYYVRLVARRWWLPLSFVVLGLSLALVYTGSQDVAYQARSTILLSPLDPGTADELPRLTPTVARLVRSDAVLLDAQRAIPRRVSGVRRRSIDELRELTSVRVPRDTSLFEVTAQGRTQLEANRLVRAIVGAATRQIARLGGDRGGQGGARTAQLRVEVFGPSIPEGKVSPTPTRNLVLGANVGLLLGIAAALLLRDPRRARIRADALAQLLEASDLVYAPLPSLGMLGQRPRRSPAVPQAVEAEPGDRHGEGVRHLGGHLWQWVQQGRRVVLLLGDIPPQTLRSVSLRLAAHLARTGIDPVVVEADFHSDGWKTGGGGDTFGLGQALEAKGKARAPDAVSVETSSQDGAGPGAFTVVPRGMAPAEPALAFASDRYRSLVERLASRHEVVFVVGPTTDWQAEVVALADAADGVVLIVPPWVARSRAATMTTLRSIGDETRLLVSVFGDPEAIPLTARLER